MRWKDFMRNDFELAARRNFPEVDLTRVGDGYLNTATQAKWAGFLWGYWAASERIYQEYCGMADEAVKHLEKL